MVNSAHFSLISERDDIVIAFGALDCGLYTETFVRLDSLAVANHQAIRGVMLLGPVVPKEVPRIIADLAVPFSLTTDSLGVWGGLFERLGTSGPIIVHGKRGRIAAIYVGEAEVEAFAQSAGASAIAPETGAR